MIEYHNHGKRRGAWGTFCPRCGKWYAGVRKDGESVRMSPDAFAHFRTHEAAPKPLPHSPEHDYKHGAKCVEPCGACGDVEAPRA